MSKGSKYLSGELGVKHCTKPHKIMHDGKEYTITELARFSGVDGKKLYYRLKRNKFVLTPDMLINERIDLSYQDGSKPAKDCGKTKGNIELYNVLGEDLSINTIESKYGILPGKFKKGVKDGLTINQIVFGVFGDPKKGESMLDGWRIAFSSMRNKVCMNGEM